MADEEWQERQPLLDSQNQTQNNGKQKHLVEFDPNGDEDNPLEWTKKYRWVIVFFLSFMATTVYAATSRPSLDVREANAIQHICMRWYSSSSRKRCRRSRGPQRQIRGRSTRHRRGTLQSLGAVRPHRAPPRHGTSSRGRPGDPSIPDPRFRRPLAARYLRG